MADEYSNQIANGQASPIVMSPPSDLRGRLRLLHCDYVQDGVDTPTIEVFRLPPGRVRVLGHMSNMYAGFTAANFDLGWEAYTESDGDVVAADIDGLDDGVAVATALAPCSEQAAVGRTKVFDSKSGVSIIATPSDALADADTFYGTLAYVND